MTKSKSDGSNEKEKPQQTFTSPEEKFRYENFYPLTAFERRPFSKRESLIHQVLYSNPETINNLRGFIHLFIVGCSFFILSYPFKHHMSTGEWYNKKLLGEMQRDSFFMICVWPLFSIWTFHAYILQKLILKGVPTWITTLYQHLTQTLAFLIALYVIFTQEWVLSYNSFMLLQVHIHLFKMVSYTQTNDLLRRESKALAEKKLKPLSPYPKNVNLKDFCLFLFYPTLTYWHEYPRAEKINIEALFRNFIQFAISVTLLYIVMDQHILVIFQNGKEYSIFEAIYSFLTYSPYLIILPFFTIWESILNCFAEITYFGDREFYQDFWNSTTFEEFNRKWNKVVHEFLYRHVYLHFIGVWKSIVIRGIRPFLFLFMLCQIPLINFMDKQFKGKVIGNYYFWFGILQGIPLIAVLYAGNIFNGWFFKEVSI